MTLRPCDVDGCAALALPASRFCVIHQERPDYRPADAPNTYVACGKCQGKGCAACGTGRVVRGGA